MIITVFIDDIQEGGGVRGILLSLWQQASPFEGGSNTKLHLSVFELQDRPIRFHS